MRHTKYSLSSIKMNISVQGSNITFCSRNGRSIYYFRRAEMRGRFNNVENTSDYGTMSNQVGTRN